MGPIGVKAHLAPFVPGHSVVQIEGMLTRQGAVSAAPFGSASILPISWMYIPHDGRRRAEKANPVAILNANYIASRLQYAFRCCILVATVAWRTNVFSIFAR